MTVCVYIEKKVSEAVVIAVWRCNTRFTTLDNIIIAISFALAK